MNDRNRAASSRLEAGRYEVRLQGHLDPRWSAWFDDLTLSLEPDGITVIRGDVADQAALHGLLRRVRDIGLPLVSVIRIDADAPPATSHGLRQPSHNKELPE